MSARAADPTDALERAGGEGAAAPPPVPALGVALLAVLGAGAAWALAGPASDAAGARRALAPPALLATFDVCWVLALVWPRCGRAAGRALATLLVLAAASPFHVALAGAAGASGGHAAASALLMASAGLVGLVAAPRAVARAALSTACFALPLAGYALHEFAGLATLWMVDASPLTAPVMLAFRAPESSADGALPAVVTLLVVALLATPLQRRSAVPLGLLALCAGLGLAPNATAQDVVRVQPFFDGLVRAGRPITVRARGARRVRVPGGTWTLPVGARGDEFVLLGATVTGERLLVEVETAGASDVQTVELAVRSLPAGERVVACLTGAADVGEVLVRPLDLPTVREAWLLFDGVSAVPSALPAAEQAAVTEFAERGPRPFPFEPSLLLPSLLPYRATAAAAERAPRLPGRVADVLLVLAGLECVLVVLLSRRRTGSARDLVLATIVPLAAAAWLVTGDELPGAVRATALVLEGENEALVLVRLETSAPGATLLRPPAGAGLVVPLRWDAADSGPSGVAAGARADIELERGQSVVLAYRVPLSTAPRNPSLRSDAAAPQGDWLLALGAWVKRAGLRIEAHSAGSAAVLPQIDGYPVFAAGRASVVAR